MSMNTAANQFEQLSEIMDRIKSWPRTMKLALAKQVLNALEVSEPRAAPRGRPVEELIGIGAGDAPPPDDQEVPTWIDEHRAGKYG